jgi:N-acyl-D-aspartate/D-glutamate deacylase
MGPGVLAARDALAREAATSRRQLTVPWAAVCSNAASIAPTGRSLDAPNYRRAYGSFARVLGHYTRDLGRLTLPDAVRGMTSLPAETFGLTDRGVLESGTPPTSCC